MASIQKRGTTYRARITRRGYTTQSQTFNSKVEAIKWARDIEHKIDNGTLPSHLKPTNILKNLNTPFKVATAEYITAHTALKKNYKSETLIIKKLTELWGELPIIEVNKAAVLSLRDLMISKNRAGATINKYYNAISKIFQMLQDEWSLTIDNPIKGIKRMPASPSRIKRITGLTLDTLMKAAEDTSPPLFTNILEIALETGMRRGELMGLQWHDVDLLNRRAYLYVTKNSEPRQVPLTQKAVEVFKSIPKTDPDKVFPVNMNWLRSCFEKTREKAKANWVGDSKNPFDDIRFHDLRHEALSKLSDAGLNVIELAHISGHKVLSMLQVYTHPSHEAIFAKLDKSSTC